MWPRDPEQPMSSAPTPHFLFCRTRKFVPRNSQILHVYVDWLVCPSCVELKILKEIFRKHAKKNGPCQEASSPLGLILILELKKFEEEIQREEFYSFVGSSRHIIFPLG